jgi:subtilisin family serine protease
MTIARRALAVLALSAAASSTAGLFALTGTAHAASVAQGSVREANVAGAIADHYIVVTKDGADPDTLADTVGGHVGTRYTSAVKGFSATMSETAAKRLAADPAVSYVEQDRTVTIESTQANPPSWGLDRIDQPTLPLDHSYTTGSAAAVHVYIIDTGVRMTQAQYKGRVTSGYDFVDHDSDASDCQGHGTHVAGTVGGSTYGVAKDVRMVAVRVLDCQGAGTYSQIIAGVDWVTKNAVKPAVANMSLGGAAGSTLDNAVQKSINSGVTYVVAGGNDSRDACTKSPARLSAAITVGATDTTDKQASFSNYGKCLDLYAPGVNILSAANTSDTATMRMSGTSQATPHVAGAAALYLNNHPTATPQQVRDAIVNAATTGAVKNAPATSPNKLLNITTLTS